MNAPNTNNILKELKKSQKNGDPNQFGNNLALLAELEPKRWITLLHLNNIIPDADSQNSVLGEFLPFLGQAIQHTLRNLSFPVDGFIKLMLPLLSLKINFSTISKKIEELDVWDKPVINLIIRLVALLEDQTSLAMDEVDRISNEKGYLDLRTLLKDDLPTILDGPPTSLLAIYEENCENLQLILAYSIIKFSSDFLGQITTKKSPYEDNEFIKLISYASIWRTYKDLWTKIKYLGWFPTPTGDHKDVLFYQPADIEEQIRFEIGSIRAQQILSELWGSAQRAKNKNLIRNNSENIDKIVKSLNLYEVGSPWDFNIDINDFKSALIDSTDRNNWEILLQFAHYDEILERVWIGETDYRISWSNYFELNIALKLLANILHLGIKKRFPSYDVDSALKRIILVEKGKLTRFLSETTSIESKICNQFLNLVTFRVNLRHIEIWDTPLIKVNKKLLLLSPALISSGSPVRAAENFIAQWNESLFSKRGDILEQELFEYFLRIPDVNIIRSVKFRNNKQQEIECDLVIWWENTLILIEVKCRKSIFSAYDAYQARKYIEKAIEQLNFRKESIIENWSSFRNSAHLLSLPTSPVNDIKLIAVTNNPHFTGWKEKNVIVTDEFCIRRFFGEAEIEAFTDEEKVATVGYIRKSRQILVSEFFSYLNDPPQVQVVREGLEVAPILLPLIENSSKIAMFHLKYTPKEYDLDLKKIIGM